ncbi:hypothetical protein [Saccharothrix violaceirubra]|uniref:Phosphodiesterase n=1 Tax=Saccharothrix violaceirubra TaxID=413306 RepID=A0A7W7WXW9_9PSEU|nr:hypothetical protein [Saccharothrix violaceirubra]MBB4967486.1 hypothetical protein [Saccharothrix violaceirubra]
MPLPRRPQPALVRLSKGVGLPGAIPDVLGLALRTEVRGAPWDVLLSSHAPGSLVWLPFPAARWCGARLSTLGGLEGVGGSGVLTATGAALPHSTRLDALCTASPMTFTLSLHDFGPVGEVSLTAIAKSPAPDFDPVVNAAGLELKPTWLGAIRARAYAGSRSGRGAPRSTG